MIRKGEQWGAPRRGDPEAEGAGDDAALARLVEAHPGARLRFVPDDACDLARAVGLTAVSTGDTELALDALRTGTGALAVNMVVLGVPPDRLRWWHRCRHVRVWVDGRELYDGRATSVVVANGQHLRARDLVPRGHPNDHRAEVQVYAVPRPQRAQLRARLATGTHVPHPAITTTTGRSVDVAWELPAALELDGERRPPIRDLAVEVVADAYRLVV